MRWVLFVSLSLFVGSTRSLSVYKGEYKDDLRHGHKVKTEISYNPNATASNIPLVVFSHGLLSDAGWFTYLAEALVGQGFVFASMDDYDNINIGSPKDYARSLRFLLQEITQDTAFPLHRQLSQNISAVGGHSEGGAGSYVSLNDTSVGLAYNNSYTAAFTLSGCLQGDMGFIEQCVARINKPIMMFAASEDCMCRAKLEDKLYGLLPPSTCRFFVELVDGSHCNYMKAPEAAQASCLTAEEIDGFCHVHKILTGDRQRELVARYVVPWLNYALKGNSPSALKSLETLLSNDTTNGTITTKHQCTEAI